MATKNVSKNPLTVEQTTEKQLASPEANEWKNLVKEVDSALKREKTYRKKAEAIQKIYDAEDKDENSFNILYANTEVLSPALYSAPPVPMVRKKQRNASPYYDEASKVMEALLTNYVEENSTKDEKEQTDFDRCMENSILEALVPGRGIIWHGYVAELEGEEEGGDDEEGEGQEGVQPAPELKEETVTRELVEWDRFLQGYAKTWKDTPWVARIHYMSADDLKYNFGELGMAVKLEKVTDRSVQAEGDSNQAGKGDESAALAGEVYELWNKENRTVYFFAKSVKDRFLKKVKDPLRLQGFFPCAEPLKLTHKTSTQLPTPLYMYYEEQAKELNRVTQRINKIIAALKVRGFYDGQVGELGDLLRQDDNVLLPTEAAAVLQGGGIDKLIWLMPVERLVQVVQALQVHREAVKGIIYEIMGISDIARGASKASETLGAQQLKTQWGSMRLKRMQKRVARFIKENLQIAAELMVEHFEPQTIRAITGLNYPSMQQKQQAQQQIQMMQQQAQMAAQMQPPPQPGQPPAQAPQPPQIPQELQEAAAAPSWEEIMGILRSDILRSYAVDIEPNSALDPSATEDKQGITELLNAMSQFFNAVTPAIQGGVLDQNTVKTMLVAVTQKFRFGPQLAEELKKSMPKPPPGPTPEQQIDLQIKQAELQDRQAERAHKEKMQQIEMQRAQQDAAIAQQDHQMKLVEGQQKMQQSQLAHANEMRRLQLESVANERNHNLKMQQATAAAKQKQKSAQSTSA